ncbi:UNVERIFIED_CONTAM: hypothetical protein FKN15_044487 [Acipenser sinensis]
MTNLKIHPKLEEQEDGVCSRRASIHPRACPSPHSTTPHSARTTIPGGEEHSFRARRIVANDTALFDRLGFEKWDKASVV